MFRIQEAASMKLLDEPLRKIEEKSMTTPTKSIGRSGDAKSEENAFMKDQR